MRSLVVIPVYNERKYIGGVLDKVTKIHPEVLVVDDGSTDGSGRAVAQRSDVQLIRHAGNLGYGQSLIDGFHYADRQRYDWVITMDCDEQHEPGMIPHFIREIATGKWDLISGSRYKVSRPDDDLPPGDRREINHRITALLNESFHLGLTDAFCGFKAHRMSAMRKLHLDVSGYAFPMQLWPQAFYAGLRITELAVRLIYNDPTRHFGGPLDDAAVRLAHYLCVLDAEATRAKAEFGAARQDDAI
jgi:glycosyltransferase involved in cell wall biosynthesis